MHALVNRHPQVALMYEAEPLELWRQPASSPRMDWPHRLEFFNQTFTRHHLDAQRFALIHPGTDAALELYQEYARAKEARIMGEKAPSYYQRLPALGKLFPEAQFLIIWRDPMECCRSAMKAARQNRFFAQHGMNQRILVGAERFARGVETLLREQRNVCEVVYEELVKNPETELRRVCDFLKIPFDPAMLDLQAADTSSVPSGEHHVGVRSGVIHKRAGAEEVLPPAFVAKSRRYAHDWKRRFSHLAFGRALGDVSPAGTSGLERINDNCVGNFWGTVDGFKRFLFRNIPLSWWAWLRSWPRARQ